MKALQLWGKQDLRIVDLPEPQIQEGDILMKIKKVGICGTDLHIFNGGMNVPLPLILGHEFVGDVVSKGNRVTNVQVGDRVVAEHVVGCGQCPYCHAGKRNLCVHPVVIGLHRPGALAEYLAIPADLVFKLPDDLSYDEGVLVEPLAIAVYAVRKARVSVGDICAVGSAKDPLDCWWTMRPKPRAGPCLDLTGMITVSLLPRTANIFMKVLM